MKPSLSLRIVLLAVILGFGSELVAEEGHRASDEFDQEDILGVTAMVNFIYSDWSDSSKSKKGDFEFDHFRIQAQTDIAYGFFASAQYRWYDGWQTPHHMLVGLRFENAELKLGQTWVPFGIDWQPFDDWGNIPYYVGLQDDYDMGVTWEQKAGDFMLDVGFFKNQQLSSGSRERYDTDVFSGDVGSDDIILKEKENEETNQLNLRALYDIPLDADDRSASIGASGMFGQLYNKTTDDSGTRWAFAAHGSCEVGIVHANLQWTFYDYDQELPRGATRDDKDWINVSAWNFAYEIPREAHMLSGGIGVELMGEALIAHVNYSTLWGGTSEADSHLVTYGLCSLGEGREFAKPVDVFLEAYQGRNDPQLSGDASGYGRDASCSDFRIELRLYYNFGLSKRSVSRKLDS